MKRFISFLLAIVMLLSLVGCGQEPAEEVQGIASYEELIDIADENRAPYIVTNAEEALNIDQYAISDKALLTQEEMDVLREERATVDKVSVEQALEDVDLFFRAWKYSYPSYYYMGEDLFLNAREQAVAAVSEYEEELLVATFGNILYDSMSFLQDYHSSINGIIPAHTESELHYLSYTDATQPFDKDENGYYQTYEGVKWYFSSCSNVDMRLEPVLLETGKVAYCPMMVIPKAQGTELDTIVLKNGEVEKEIKLRWVTSADVQGNELDQQYKASAEDDVFYIDYLTMRADVGDVNEFIQMAEEAKQYKAVIFDLRHTQGQEHWQIIEWIKVFTGETPEVAAAFLARNNALHTLQNYQGFKEVSLGNEDCDTWYTDGHKVPNTIPIIILTDKSCGSSVESAVNYLRTIENSFVIGGNTAGCAQGGSTQTYYLPYSGVPFAVGGFMQFDGEVKNIDGIGYEPDIWCNPANVKDLALKFIEYYGLKELELEQAEPTFYSVEGVSYPVELGAPVLGEAAAVLATTVSVSEAAEQITNVGDAYYYYSAIADTFDQPSDTCRLFMDLLAYDYDELGLIFVERIDNGYCVMYVKSGENYYPFDPFSMSDAWILDPQYNCICDTSLDALGERIMQTCPYNEPMTSWRVAEQKAYN